MNLHHRKSRLGLWLLLVALLIAGFASSSQACDATRDLQASVKRLNAQLGTGPQAVGWRRFLLLNLLETQAAKGEQADIRTLQMIHERFASGATGLDHPLFTDVRISLERQIDNLTQSQIGEITVAIEQAKTEFRPIPMEALAAYRDQVLRELANLKTFYRQSLPSDERAEAFFLIQLDELTAFLPTIEFERAPEVSVGKIKSMIRSVRKDLEKVVEKIDALPFDDDADGPQPDDAAPDDENGPKPDETEATLEDLQKQQEVLERQIEELKKKGRIIRRADAPRAKLRAQTFRQLVKFESGFNRAAEKFGDPYFVAAHLTFQRFLRAYYYGTSDNLQENYLEKLEQLGKHYAQLNDPSNRQAFGQVGAILRWMDDAFQAPHLVTAIRARHSFPNTYVTVSSNLLNQLGSQTMIETRPLNENISGRLTRGTVTTVGSATLELQDDPNQVHLSIRLHADTNSRVHLRQGKLVIFANANGQAEARRSLFANVGGLFAGPAYGAAQMESQFCGTSSCCDLVNRIATKQFAKAKPESDQKASQRARHELLDRFERESLAPVQKGQDALGKAKAKSLNRSGRIPEIYVHSQADQIVLVGKKTSPATLGAPGLPIEYSVGSDVTLRLHESLLNNYLHPIFSGKTFSDQELSEELEKLLGTKPAALTGSENPGEDEAQNEPFSITFTDVLPVQFQFEEDEIAVIVSGKKFSQGDKNIPAGLKIIIRFRIVRSQGTLKLVRVGKAEIDFVEGVGVKTPKVVAFRSFLDGRLNPKEAKKSVAVDLPENLIPVDKVEGLKDSPVARALQLNQCRFEKGWAYLGWAYRPEAVDGTMGYNLGPVDLPAIWTEKVIKQLGKTYTPADASSENE